MKEVIPDPLCSGFRGIYVGDKDTAPLPRSDVKYAELAAYLKAHNILYEELSKEEKKQFGIYHDLI